jgi:dUTPase
MSLYIYVVNPELRQVMRDHTAKRRVTDSGCDLMSPSWVNDKQYGAEMRLGVYCAALTESGDSAPYLLLARSSTSLTPLRMSNQVGLADMGYRGELIARVDVMYGDTYSVLPGTRLFQIVQHNWMPWKNVVLVDSLDQLPAAPDNRGSGGFGSTGT